MATPKQTAANRRNAQRSTGPRSDDGKARAAMNNFKHGIYAKSPIAPGEDPAQHQALRDAYTARFNPQTIEQLYLTWSTSSSNSIGKISASPKPTPISGPTASTMPSSPNPTAFSRRPS